MSPGRLSGGIFGGDPEVGEVVLIDKRVDVIRGFAMAAGIRGIANEYGIQSSYEKDVILHRMRGPETEEMLRKARDRRMDVLGFIPEDPVITECDLRDTSIMAAEGHRPSVRVVHSILEEQGLLREAHVYEATGMGC